MSAIERISMRRRRWFERNLAHLRGVTAPGLTAAALVLATAILVVTTAHADWTELAHGFASNIVTAALLAGFAYFVFVLRFRKAKLAQYIEHQQRGRQLSNADQPLLRTVVDELLSGRPPRSCLLVGEADIARTEALGTLAGQLADRKKVPIQLDLGHEGAVSSVSLAARDRFITELVGSAGDTASGGRVFTHLLSKRRAVALLDGLDNVAEGMSLRARRQRIGELLRECLQEGLPFVAALPDHLVPSLTEVAVVRIPKVSRHEVAVYLVSRLRGRGYTFEPPLDVALKDLFAGLEEPTRDPAHLELAANLLIERVRRGEVAAEAAADLFAEPSAFRRHLGWMCEWSLACRLGDASTDSSAVALALRTIGAEAHYRQLLPTTWDDAVAELDAEEARRFSTGVATLVRRGVLTASDHGRGVLRFTHTSWLAFAGAMGIGLDRQRWSDLLRPGTAQATLEAFTAALLLDVGAPCRRERSFLGILMRHAARKEGTVTLDAALAALDAIQLEPGRLEIGTRELAALARAWRSSTETVRLSFLEQVDFRRAPALVDFLWGRLSPDGWSENRYRVRRAICEQLASLGRCAWDRLAPGWRRLAAAGRASDLSARGRHVAPYAWDHCGMPLAHLGWILPTLVLELDEPAHDEAVELLREVAAIAARGWDAEDPDGRVDIGIEISLAEGFKLAAARAGAGARAADGWESEARSLYASARSWLSQLVLLQSLALRRADSGALAHLAGASGTAAGRHPFVREAAALLLLDGPDRKQRVWQDDVQALDDGGLELTPQAHRLLAVSTLLINLAELAFSTRKTGGVASRDEAFTSVALPDCFVRSSHTATMLDCPCDCDLELCGKDVRERLSRLDRRPYSRAFAERAEATCQVPLLADRRAFSGRAFRDVWRRLDDALMIEADDAA